MNEVNTKHFYKDLKNEVFTYLKENKIPLCDTNSMLRKLIFTVVLSLIVYSLTMYLAMSEPMYLLIGAPFFSLCAIFLALGSAHDGSHRSFSSKKPLNRVAEMAMNVVGVSSILWYKKHVLAHHNNTNVHGKDQDTDTGNMIRLHNADESFGYQKYQHLYAWFLYGLHMVRWLTFDDISEYMDNTWKLNRTERKKLLIEIIITKIWHYSAYIIVPYYLSGSIGYTLGFYFITWCTFGVLVATTFNMAHVTSVQKFYTKDDADIPKDWAIHQLETTSDFACSSKFLTWAVGGLNFQVIHHIFPNISHINYPAMQKIVKKFCIDRGVTYHEYPTVSSALKDHYKHLKAMGATSSSLLTA
jgi:linoleoyl-CoA desaturase